jgi:hypothetical protein
MKKKLLWRPAGVDDSTVGHIGCRYVCREIIVPNLEALNMGILLGWIRLSSWECLWCCYIMVDLQQLHSKTMLAHIGAFPNKCTIKHPLLTKATWKVWNFMNTTFCLEKDKLVDNVILTQNHAWHITQVGWNNYICTSNNSDTLQHHSVTCSV